MVCKPHSAIALPAVPGDIFLIRMNAAADTLWSKTYASATNDQGRALAVDHEGNFAICALTSVSSLPTESSVVMKVDSQGAVIWNRPRPGELADIIIGSNGQYFVAGRSSGRMSLTAMDSENGDSLWQKDYNYDQYWASRTYSLTSTIDGGFALIGSWNDGAIGDHIYLVKTDANGEKQWDKLIATGRGYAVVQTFDGGYLVGGTAGFNSWGSSQASFDFFMQFIESDGAFRWQKSLGIFKPNFLESCESVVQTKSGNLIGAGSGILAKYNVNGDSLWAKKLSETGINISQVLETASGDLLISGTKKDQPVQGAYDHDVFLIKTDAEASEFPAWGSSFPTDTSSTVSKNFRLRQNYPNPFNGMTTIEFSLPENGDVIFQIFDNIGRQIIEISSSFEAGTFKVPWDGNDRKGLHLSSGVYFFRLTATNTAGELQFSKTIKMLLVR